MELSQVNILVVGRLLSVVYGTLLVLLLYFFIARLLGDSAAGFIAALLLAGSDLNVTYSHYAVPEVAHTFWIMLSSICLFMYQQRRRDWVIKLCLGVGAGMSLAFKFDPSPILAFAVLLLLQRGRPWKEKLTAFAAVSVVALAVLLAAWATVDIEIYARSVKELAAQNQDTIKKDHHLLYNPLLYLAAVVGGTSLPVFLSSIGGLIRSVKGRCGLTPQSALTLILAPAILFVLYWSGDATFVRRASVFIPFCALFAGLFIMGQRRCKLLLASSILGYTFLLTAASRSSFIDETRYEAKKYLVQSALTRGTGVAYTPYASAVVKDLPNKLDLDRALLPSGSVRDQVGLVVLHETYYGRYGKYFTTPFRTPEDCDEVYHCNVRLLQTIQALMSDKMPFVLLQRFEVRHPFPERIVFKAMFGTYETFLGDVLIYGRRDLAEKKGRGA
jgi:uncharacterized membrane protein